MNRGEKTDSIPIDLIPDILSRLPAKSIARFRCVSKVWWSLLHKPYFTELFFTSSSARPRLLIVVKQDDEWFFFSSPHPQNPYEKSSLVVAADFHTKISFDTVYGRCSYASGLLYFPSIRISKEDKDQMKVICSPSTGQYAILPEPRTTHNTCGGLLGFDPVGKQFKVLVMKYNCDNDEWVHQILTLGTETLRWRMIQCPFEYHKPLGNGICINGVLYYIAYVVNSYYLLGCFDVRSEKLKFQSLAPYCHYGWSTELINYKGKVGVVNFEDDYDGGFPLKLQMWVLEDVEKPEWSKYVYTLRSDEIKFIRDDDHISVVGVTALGEIVLTLQNARKPFYVFYFNPEKNTLLSVEIQGLIEDKEEWSGDRHIYTVVDHVEDLNFDVIETTYAAISISRPDESKLSTSYKEDHHQVRTVAHQQQDRRMFECVNKFDALRLLEDD